MIRRTGQDLRVCADHIEIEVWQDTNRIVATDGRDDGGDRIIRERLHEVVRSGLWVRRDPARVAQRVSRFNDAATELILKLLLARGIAMRNGTGTTPGMGHRSDGVATPQTRGFDGRTQYWHSSLSRDGSLQRHPDGRDPRTARPTGPRRATPPPQPHPRRRH